MNNTIRNNKGAIGILTALILGAVLTMLAVTILLTGISSRNNAFLLNQSDKVFIPLEGCAENALIMLNRDDTYAGGTYALFGLNCSVVVSGSGSTRNLAVTAEKDGITRDMAMSVQLTPDFGIIEWTE